MNNQPASVLVCGTTSRWAVLLRRFCSNLRIREARSPELLADLLAENPWSCVAWSIEQSKDATGLTHIQQLRRSFPHALWVGLLNSRELQGDEPIYFEAGFQRMIRSFEELPDVGKLAAVHMQRQALPALSFTASIHSMLPWKP